MTKGDVESVRNDVCHLIIMATVKELGLGHGRCYTSNHITRVMDGIRQQLFNILADEKELDKVEHEFTSTCLNNTLNIFEGMMLYKEGCNLLDLLYKGLKQQIKESAA